MTTLTQSELDDLRRNACARIQSGIYLWLSVPARTVLALLDHIAQLTAERDEYERAASRLKAELHLASCMAKARIAELEAHPSAQSSDNNVERVARIIREEIVRQYRDDERGKCPAGRTFYEEQISPELIAVEAIKAMRDSLPPAQFVTGMREALKDCADDLEAEIEERYRNCKEHPSMRVKYARDIEPVKAARAILAEADKAFREPASQRAFIRETATIEGNNVIVRVPIDALQTAPNFAWDKHFGAEAEKWKVVDVHLFAKEFVSELNRESETGETLITSMLDRAAIEVAEQGGDGIDYAEADKGCAAAESQHG